MSTTLNKLEYLDETKGQIKTALNTKFNLQILDSDTFRSYVSKISNIYTNWPKVENEGTNITLNNTRKGKIVLDLKGNGGKNLINVSDVTLSGSGYVFNITNLTIPNGTYTLNIGEMPYTDLGVAVIDKDGNEYFNATRHFPVNIDATNGIKQIRVYNGNSAGGTFKKIQLESGSTATSYEPYGASVTSNNSINIEGKNLVDTSKSTLSKSIFAGGTILNDNNKDITDYIDVSNFSRITISFTTEFETVSWNTCFFDKDKNVVAGGSNGYGKAGGINGVSPSVPSTAKYIRFGYPKDSQDVMLEGNDTKTTYTPYVSQTYPINLGTKKLNTGDSIEGTIDDWEILRADTTTEAITDSTLITQLNNLKNNATSYDTATNISSTYEEGNAQMIINASALMKGGN